MNRLQSVLCWCAWTVGPGTAVKFVETTSCLSEHFMYKMKSVIVMVTRPSNATVNCIGLFICVYKPTHMAFPRNTNATCRHVLTSASCLKQDDFEYMRVHINNNVTDVHVRGVESIIYHPNYDETTHASDVALVRMDEPEDFPDGVPPLMFFNPLPVLSMEIKTTNKMPQTKLNTGIFTYQNYNSSENRCMVYLNRSVYYQPDPVECHIENNPHEHFEKKYWYTTFCSKNNKSEFIPQGTLLVHCKISDTNLMTIKTIGLFSYSLATKKEQVARFTVLYWYKTWTFAEMHADLRRIRTEREETATARRSTTADAAAAAAAADAAADASAARDFIPRDYSHDAYAYDGVPMDRNPCANAASVGGGFLRPASSLRGAIVTVRRLFSGVSENRV